MTIEHSSKEKGVERFKNHVRMTSIGPMDSLVKHPEGDWVTYEDYAALERENEELRQQKAEWIVANGPGGWIDDLRKQSEPLQDRQKYEALYRTVNDLMIVIGMHGEVKRTDDRVTCVMDALFAIDGGTPLPSETNPAVKTFRQVGPEKGMSTMCECGATMLHHIAQDHLGNACVCPSHETRDVCHSCNREPCICIQLNTEAVLDKRYCGECGRLIAECKCKLKSE